ncbi:MAG TPA: DUF1501 domain-containing protein [Frankiaceae bacterium]|nr:DUF1501 domain-containing protein [Frankiaceae bacterium]
MTRTISRRQVLRGAATVAGAQLLSPIVFRAGTAWGDAQVDPATANRMRLVIIDLIGGNDGLNTVVPMSGAIRDVYEKVRVTTELPADTLLPLGAVDGGTVGLNPNLPTMYGFWQQNRMAVVQGCDYPGHDYSHFVSDDIWQTGFVNQTTGSGWLGRHLDRVGIGEGELRGVGIGLDRLPLALRGTQVRGEEINSVYETQFTDGGEFGVTQRRHAEFAAFSAAPYPVDAYYGDMCRRARDLAIATTGLTAAQPGGVANQMLTARTLLTANLGTEVVFVGTGGYDTHDNQLVNHANLLRDLDRGIEAFFHGTRDGVPILNGSTPVGPLPQAIAEKTLVMTFSEFGRRIGDNGTGTDHGAAAPMFLIGPPAPPAGSGRVVLTPGLHRDHPAMGSVLAPADNLEMTTDMRSIYQSVLTNWISDASGPSPDEGDDEFRISGPGYGSDGSLTGLFGVA